MVKFGMTFLWLRPNLPIQVIRETVELTKVMLYLSWLWEQRHLSKRKSVRELWAAALFCFVSPRWVDPEKWTVYVLWAIPKHAKADSNWHLYTLVLDEMSTPKLELHPEWRCSLKLSSFSRKVMTGPTLWGTSYRPRLYLQWNLGDSERAGRHLYHHSAPRGSRSLHMKPVPPS